MPRKPKSPQCEDALQLFILDCESQRFTKRTIGYYQYNLSAFIAWLDGQAVKHVHEITSGHVRSYMAGMQERNLSGYTLLAAYRAIRRFCNFCVSEDWIQTSPTAKTKPPRVDKEIRRVFTQEEFEKLLDACESARETALLTFLLDTGLRLAEVIALNGEHVDLAKGIVTVKSGKGRKDRITFLGATARKNMLRYYLESFGSKQGPAPQTPVWSNIHTGERLTPSGLTQLVKRIAKRAGVKASMHAFRRTHATWSIKAGLPLPALQRLLGHSELSTTQRYLGLNEDDLKAAHEKSSPVDNLLR
jgi:integrase/recombinase XerD